MVDIFSVYHSHCREMAICSHIKLLYCVNFTGYSVFFTIFPSSPSCYPLFVLFTLLTVPFGRLGVGFGIGRILSNWLTGTLFQYYGSTAVFAELTSATACCTVICGTIYIHLMYKTQKVRKNCNNTKQSVHILFQSDTESDE